MATDWGAYTNRQRVGVDWSASRTPTQADPSYPVTATIQQQTDYTYFAYDGHVSWSGSFGSGSHTGQLSNSDVYNHATVSRTFTASYSGTTTFSITISGTTDGTSGTATHTRTGTVPRRPTAAPTAPGTPSAGSIASSSATLSWTGSSDMKGTSLTQHDWQVSTSSDFSAIVKSGSTTSTSVSVTGLSPNITYYARVRTVGDGWDASGRTSGWSGTRSFTTLMVAPGQPTGVTATRNSDSQITVSWTTNITAGNPAATTVVQQSVNGGAWTTTTTLGNVSSAVVATTTNRRTQCRVQQSNTAGSSAWSGGTAAVFTTPAAPTSVTATRQANNSITLAWANAVAFSEYQTQVWHGTVSGSTTTWDSAALATLASGVTTYNHASPNTSQVHVYRLRAVNTTGGLTSGYTQSNSVQLLTAPNAPTLANLPTFATRTAALVVTWVHNPVDTTAQTAYEAQRSADGGSTWQGTGKVTSATSSYTLAANAYAANTAVIFRVRTWGAATTGGSDGTGASAWSGTDTVTFKTLPVASITGPADGSTIEQATLTVELGFAQGEGGTPVSSTITLLQGATVIETVTTTTLASTQLGTRVRDGIQYTLRATVLDSFGQTSAQVSSTFSVDYVDPVAPIVGASYLQDQGAVQITLTLPGEPDAVARTNLATTPWAYTPPADGPYPGLVQGEAYAASSQVDGQRVPVDPFALVGGTNYAFLLIEAGEAAGDYFDGDTVADAFTNFRWTGGQNASASVAVFKAAPATVTLTRAVDGGTEEVLLDRFAWTGDAITILDTTPTIHGTNTYTATTYTADGAASIPVSASVVTYETRWAFLNAGPGYADMVAFYGNLSLGSAPKRTSALVQAAGRSRPIALFGQVSTLDVSGKATIVDGEGSTVQEIETFILNAGRVCLRDPSGRRVFGALAASIDSWQAGTAELSLTVSEAT